MKIWAKLFSSVIYIFIAGMLLIAAAGCSAQTAKPLPSQAEEKTGITPTIVQKDGNIILLSADSSVTLCPVSEMVKNGSNGPRLLGMISHEHNYMYFLQGYDSKTGTGTMMGVNTDAKSTPVTVSGGVYSAQDSYNGDVLFIKNFKDGAGDLYFYTRGGSPELKVQNAIPELYGFSPDGKSFYYAVKESGGYALFENFQGTAEKIFEGPAKDFRYPFIDMKDNGSILYGSSDNMESLTLYMYSNGKSSEAMTLTNPNGAFLLDSGDCIVYNSRNLDDLNNDGIHKTLYYNEIGKGAVCISKDACLWDFPSYTDEYPSGKSFLLGEEDPNNPKPTEEVIILDDSNISDFFGEPATTAEDTSTENKIDLYEYTIGGDKTFIAKADSDDQPSIAPPEINKGFTAVSYDLDGALYISLDKNGTWVSRQLSGGEIGSEFDGSGNNFYWIDRDYKLYRMSIPDGKTDMLKDGITSFTIIGDEVYATDNINMYRISDGATLCDSVDTVTEAEGGVYIRKTNGDMLYFADGSDKSVTVIKDSQEAPLSGARIRLSYLSSQDSLTLKNLSEDADYYMNKYNLTTDDTSISTPHGTLQEDAALSDSFLPGSVPDDDAEAAALFSEGFNALIALDSGKGNTDQTDSIVNNLRMASSLFSGDYIH